MASDGDNCGRSPFLNRNKVDEGEGEGAGGSVVDEYYRGTHDGLVAGRALRMENDIWLGESSTV